MTTTVQGAACANATKRGPIVTDDTTDGNEPTSGKHYFHVVEPCDECAAGQRRLAWAMVAVGVVMGGVVSWALIRHG